MHRIKLIHNFRVTASLFFHMKLLLIMKMISYSNANKTYFHKKSFALSLVLKVRFWNSEMKLWLIMKMISYSNANKTYFHKKSFALSLVLKVRFWNSEMAYSYKLLYGASSIPNLSKAHSGSLQSRC